MGGPARRCAYPESEGEVPPCDGCGGSSRYWHAVNRQWNLVLGGPEAKGDPGGILCPNCFIDRAASLGLGRRWTLSAVDPDEITHETVERIIRERVFAAGSHGAASTIMALFGLPNPSDTPRIEGDTDGRRS